MRHTDDVNQHARATQRANILEGAKQVFARKGKAATMADVAAAAGVSQGLAYRYFTSKEEIYRELIEQAVQNSLTSVQPAPVASATPGERLAQLITKMVESRRDQPEVFQFIEQVLSSEQVPEDFRERLERQGQRFIDEVRQLIIEGQATGEVVAGDPEQLVIAIAASLTGLASFALHQPAQFRASCPEASVFLRMFKP